ncbi:MAG: hypothetical protein COA85_10430 [Robiginitomaculum sp.]|nr:MAG: hypothetical protein COA85_10430 [Robiginitomaculum sp.]
MQIIELTVTLEHVKPTVLRIIEVPLGIRLDQLHLTLQAAMGWENAHLYMFMAADSRWGVPDPAFGGDELPASETTLEEALSRSNVKTLQYLYDFGDDWMHRIDAGKISDANSGKSYPNLTEADGKCPPEDVGGAPGYEEFLEAMTDTKHSEHKKFKDWHGDIFAPNKLETEKLKLDVLKLAK